MNRRDLLKAAALSMMGPVATVFGGLAFRELRRWHSSDFLGYGCCLHCGETWDHCDPHVTWYGAWDGVDGIFVLCEPCWSKLTPAERRPYYRYWVLEKWKKPERWLEVEDAVLTNR